MSHEETKNSGCTAFTSLATTLTSVTPLKVGSKVSGRPRGPQSKTPADYREDIVYQLQNCYKVTGDGHWEWQGTYCDRKGGRVLRYSKESGFANYRAASCSYELHKGPVPEGYVVTVMCSNHKCIHPDHIDAISKSQRAQMYAQAPGANAHPLRGPNMMKRLRK